MKMGWVFGLALAAAVAAFADNAGRVKALGVVTGVNGLKYILVNHTTTGIEFGCRTNSSDKLWGTFYVPWDDNEIVAVSQYSSLQKALQATDLTVEASSGVSLNNGPVSGWASVVDRWYLVK